MPRPGPPGKDPQPPRPPGERAVNVLWSFGKCLATLLPVYLAGYFGFSILLVLFGLLVYMGWKHSRLEKVMRLKSAMYLLENERQFTMGNVMRTKRDLPPWVNFPDVEKVEWLNKILQQAWPFVGQYLEKMLLETVAPAIRASSVHLQTLSFTKVNLGDKALKVVGVKAHTEHDKRQVLLDLYVSYAGDVEINVEIKKYFCKAGVKGIQLHGKLRVILEPLIGDVPLVGAITMFFIRKPKLDINWTGLTNLLDIPGLNAMSDTMIMDVIASHLVLPNRLTIPLVADLHVAQLRSPLPRGVVRIHLLEAEDLTTKDTVIKGFIDGKSDPYAVLRVGTQTFTSRHVDSNLNPQWREMYEVIVHEVPGQELEVELFDKDPDQDDFLGRYFLHSLINFSHMCWFSLKDVPSGSVHLRLEWLSLLPSAARLSEVIERNYNLTSKTSDPPSAAILAVYLDQAHALPLKKGNKDPSPMVQISIQDTTKESRTCYGTSDPVWEDAFTFFIPDPRKQDIDIQVKDDDRALSLGSLTIPLARLLESPGLVLDQWFSLENSGSASRIYIKTILRVRVAHTHTHTHAPSEPRPAHPLCSQGVLRIHLAEAQNLIAKDNFMGGMVKGKSDPYVKMKVAGITYRSHTIKENLNPVWNELYEVILTQLPGQDIQFELFDKDIDQDDFLGSGKEPKVGAEILLKGVSHRTKVRYVRSTSPRWDEACHFLVRDPREETLMVKVRENNVWTLFRAPMPCVTGPVSRRALAACSKDGADPYVSLLLLPDKKGASKRKTATKKRDLNPEFNERFDFDFSLEESTQRRLDLSVKNNVSFMSRERELIGKFLLDLDQVDLKAGVTQW
uniref:Extended synaptotagmin-like protein 1a n=1 Tax=Gadus morhua TaxID=8049 RepID=A0A8C5AN82_GADMO